MVNFVFSNFAKKGFLALPSGVQSRLTEKLVVLKSHPDIFFVLRRLRNFAPATHRLRIGDYRLILQLMKQEGDELKFLVLDVGDRKDIYR